MVDLLIIAVAAITIGSILFSLMGLSPSDIWTIFSMLFIVGYAFVIAEPHSTRTRMFRVCSPIASAIFILVLAAGNHIPVHTAVAVSALAAGMLLRPPSFA